MIPDLNSMPPEDLLKFYEKYFPCTKKNAEDLFGKTFPGYIKATRDLASWASYKASLIICRQYGERTSAMIYASICDRIYSTLPSEAQF